MQQIKMETNIDNNDLKTGKNSPCIHPQPGNGNDMASLDTDTAAVIEKGEDDQQKEDVVVREPLPKKLKLDELDESADSTLTCSINEEGNNDDGSRMETLDAMKARVVMKEDVLDKLKKVEFYKKKWNIDELKNQISDWKGVATAAFEDLFQKSSTERESLTKEELLEHLGVNPADLLGIDILK